MTEAEKYMILNSPSPVNNSGGKLASLWRKILVDIGATKKVKALLALQKTSIKLDSASKALSNVTANERNCYANTLTFKGFISLIRTLLKITDFDITITLKSKNGKVSQHTMSFKYDEDDEGVDDE